MRTVACADAWCLFALAMFPMDMYTGHADLSPRNCNKDILSEDRMIGAIVAPSGKAFCV